MRIPAFLRRRRQRERDLDEEIAAHLALSVRDRIDAGEDPREARFASLREFGNVMQTRELTRLSWSARWIDQVRDVLGDVRYSVRLLVRSPGHALVVMAVLAIGIGTNIVAFGYYKALALTPVPGVRGSAAIHTIGAMSHGSRPMALSYQDYTYIRDHSRTYAALAGSALTPFTFGRGLEARRVYGEVVTGNYFEMLGVRAQLGRTLQPSDDVVPRGHPVAVVSHTFWRDAFDSDRGIVGRTIHMNNVPLTIVGVTDAAFHGTVVGLDMAVFVPVMMQPVLSAGWNALDNPRAELLFGLGRTKPGVDLPRAREELALIGARMAAERPWTEVRERAVALPMRDSPQGLQTYAGPLVALMGVVAVLLLVVVCANVAGLVLVRTLARRGETAARLAMGATRARIARLLVIEALLVTIPGSLVGLWTTRLADHYLVGWRGLTSAPLFVEVDAGPMVALALALACVSAVLCGLLPGLAASRVDLAAAMSDSLSPRGSSTSRMRSVLVVCQVAAALILMVGAALVARSLTAARSADPGFEPQDVASVLANPDAAGYSASDGYAYYQRLQDSLRSMPGVESVSLMWTPLLMVFDFGGREFVPEGHARTADDDLQFRFNIVAADHFRTLRIPILAGREFLRDEGDRRVAIVNETLARRFWGSPPAAIGKQLRTADWTTAAPVTMTVVGVARDIKYTRLNEAAQPYVYMPHGQAYTASMLVLVRGTAPRPDFLDRVRQRVHTIDTSVPLLDGGMLVTQTNLSFAMYDVAARVLRIVGLAAVALAALGIYGLVAYTVKQATHEIGIRMAIGAGRIHIVRRYLTGGLWLSGIGAALGIAGSFAGAKLLTVLLYGVSPNDTFSFAAATATVVAAAGLAALIPAWRAARVDPLISLRRH